MIVNNIPYKILLVLVFIIFSITYCYHIFLTLAPSLYQFQTYLKNTKYNTHIYVNPNFI